MCWKEGTPFSWVPPHPAAPFPEKTVQALVLNSGAFLQPWGLERTIARDGTTARTIPTREDPWAASFFSRSWIRHSSLLPWSAIIMPSTMIDHMELEPECLAPCVLLPENPLCQKNKSSWCSPLQQSCRGEGLRRGGVEDGRGWGGEGLRRGGVEEGRGWRGEGNRTEKTHTNNKWQLNPGSPTRALS